MNTVIVVTLIICCTVFGIFACGVYLRASEMKEVRKNLDKFNKAFGNKYEKKDSDDDLPKFGGF